jgi:hypothetical protein
VNTGRSGAAEAGAALGLWLEWERAGSRSRRQLDKPLTIGRDPSSAVRLEDAAVSRRHAVVSVVAGQALVDATGSTNGIIVEHGRVEKLTLLPGRSCRIGEATFRVVLAPVPLPAPALWPVRGPGSRLPEPPSTPPSFAPARKQRPTPRALIPATAIALVAFLLVGSILGLTILHPFAASPASGPSAASTQRAWSVPSGALPSAAPVGLVDAIESFAPPTPVFGSGFEVDATRAQGDWAISFGHAVAGASDVNTPTETIVVIAHRVGAGWQTLSNRESGFCGWMNQLPEEIMDSTERSFYGCG